MVTLIDNNEREFDLPVRRPVFSGMLYIKRKNSTILYPEKNKELN